MEGLQFAESIAVPEDGVIFIPSVGLVFKVGNPQRNSKLSPVPEDHIKTVKAYLKMKLIKSDSGRVGGLFTPVRVRYSCMVEGDYKIVGESWEKGHMGAGYAILWTPPAIVHIK